MTRHLHPIEGLILAALSLLWPVRELLVALVALALLLAGWRPSTDDPAPPLAFQVARVGAALLLPDVKTDRAS